MKEDIRVQVHWRGCIQNGALQFGTVLEEVPQVSVHFSIRIEKLSTDPISLDPVWTLILLAFRHAQLSIYICSF